MQRTEINTFLEEKDKTLNIRQPCTGWYKKTGTFEKPNKNWRNPRKKMYWQKLNHY